MSKYFGILGFMLIGCGTAPMDTTGENEAEINSAWEKITGAYEGQGNGIGGIVFESTADVHGHHFFADVDNGIRCIKAPCPSSSRIEGYYTVTSKNLWLHVEKGDSGVRDYSGKYSWKSVYLNGKYLELTKDGETQSLKTISTYCQEAQDCADQDYAHILCVGYATCSQNRCGYKCGVPQPTKCGNATCGAGTYCCNPVMSICAPKGGFCIQ